MDGKTIQTKVLVQYLAQVLDVTQYRDYCPNGLQVQGKPQIRHLVSGVTACQALIEAAVAQQADVILVHHGYFWRGEDPCVVGQKQRRLKLLLEHDINLLAYHLPLDMHVQWGNNAQLGRLLSLTVQTRFGEDDLGWLGIADDSVKPSMHTVGDLVQRLTQCLGRKPLLIGDPEQELGQIAWCTGAAQSLLGAAIDAGATVFLSGEISEPTVHLARES
ncbi:MAG: Nif3-like dinuclear metal center hexameric protein, partial [Herbaspirillum sp.]